jgi:hypothetical protein
MSSLHEGGENMSDEDRYRRYAKFCREQASLLGGSEAERWLQLAVEYERLADVASGMDADGIPPVPAGPAQQQPMQQQQSKMTPEDEK